MTRTRASALSVLASVTLLGSLTACGGGDDETGSTSSSSAATSSATGSDTASSSETASESPSEDATSTESSGSSASSESSGDGGGSGDKPSKDEVVSGLVQLSQKAVGATGSATASGPAADAFEKAASCIVDEIYDEASPQTLQALADQEEGGGDPADQKLITDASATCQEELGASATGSATSS